MSFFLLCCVGFIVTALMMVSSKQVKVDTHHTKEQLRNAVNRAPMVPVPFMDVRLLMDDGVAAEVAEQEVMQGPDMFPGSITHYEEPSIRGGFQRISIVDDSDVESSDMADSTVKVEAVPSADSGIDKSIGSPPTQAVAAVAVRDCSSSSIKSISTTAGMVKSNKNEIRSSKPVGTGAKATSTVGAYELEKTILQYQRDDVLLGKFVKGLKRKAVCSSLSKSRQLEPAVIFLLLRSVSEVFGRISHNWSKVIDWFESVSGIPGFALLFELMTSEEQLDLQQRLSLAFEHDAGDDRLMLKNAFGIK
jgi:hypothetical protein